MTLPSIDTTLAALIAGAVTSLHCAGMCGPLACAMLPRPSVAYHGGRLLSYGAVGALCGGLGEVPVAWVEHDALTLLPWFLVAVLLGVGLGVKLKLPRPWWIHKFYVKTRLEAARLPEWQRGAVLGLLTPLLPCGPLYLMFAACLLSGSAVRGLEFALAFALGTVPLLWLSQSWWHRLSLRLSPQRLLWCQRGLALTAAAVLVWRLRGTLGFGGEEGASCCELAFAFPMVFRII